MLLLQLLRLLLLLLRLQLLRLLLLLLRRLLLSAECEQVHSDEYHLEVWNDDGGEVGTYEQCRRPLYHTHSLTSKAT